MNAVLHPLRWWFGKPDGFFPALRCRLLGHRWERCYDRCCNDRLAWCGRCTSRHFTPATDTDFGGVRASRCDPPIVVKQRKS